MATMLDAAQALAAAGFSVVPASVDGTKAPLRSMDPTWKEYQRRRATDEEITRWFADGHPGIGIVCGAISGNLEMLEFEGRAVDEGLIASLWSTAVSFGIFDLLRRITTGYVERSPSGGVHFFYRVDGSPLGNVKLASRNAHDGELNESESERREQKLRQGVDWYPPRVLIETRGEGGFVVCAPSQSGVHPSGQPWTVLAGTPVTVPEISVEERDALHAACRSLSSYQTSQLDSMPAVYERPAPAGQLSPGEDYNERADWADVLSPHGWQVHHRQGNATHWTRPGKDRGVSATTGGDAGDLMYVYTTSSELPDSAGLSKWRVYAFLNCGGDFSRAASELRRQGYGSEQQRDSYTASVVSTSDWALLIAQSGNPSTPIIVPTDEDEAFWNARPIYDHIRQFARARLCPPYSVLAHVLLQVVASIGPEVKLPPVIGGKGSLNLFVAVVGKSGDGKGMSRAVAREAVNVIDPADSFTIGSGEGIAATYVKPAKASKDVDIGGLIDSGDAVSYIRHRALFHIAEVATLEEISKRGGSTIIGELNKLYIGEHLGFQNRAKETRLPVKEHTYRACLTMDVQPGKANVLFDNEATGFPQRFMFVEAKDPGLPDEDVDEPEPMTWRTPDELHAGKVNASEIVIDVCQLAREHIRTARKAVDRGLSIGGHTLQTQLKVAAALAILDGRSKVLDDDWLLAGYLMRRSERVMAGLVQHKADKAKLVNKARAESEAEREVVKSAVLDAHAVVRVSDNVLRILRDGPLTRVQLRSGKVTAKDRPYLDDALNLLTNKGKIAIEEVPNRNGSTGHVYRLG